MKKRKFLKEFKAVSIIFIVALLWGFIFLLFNKHTDWLSYAEGFTMAVAGCYLGWWCGRD